MTRPTCSCGGLGATFDNSMSVTSKIATPRDQTQISFAHASSSLCVATKRGKGKVLSRRSASPSTNLPVLHLTSFGQEYVDELLSLPATLTPNADFVDGLNYRDIDQGESDHYPHPRFASRLKSAWVACKGLDKVASLHQAHALMRAGSPVKLIRTPLVAKLSQWTLDHLVRAVCLFKTHPHTYTWPTTVFSAKVLHLQLKTPYCNVDTEQTDGTRSIMGDVVQPAEPQRIH